MECNPVLYILIRQDMKSLRESIGKASAQIAHAANSAVFSIKNNPNISEKLKFMLSMWENEDDNKMGCGTTIVLGGIQEIGYRDNSSNAFDYCGNRQNWSQSELLPRLITISDIEVVVDELMSTYSMKFGYAKPTAIAGIYTDPTYPLRDGDVVHLFPAKTAGWVFGNKEELEPVMKDLILYGSVANE